MIWLFNLYLYFLYIAQPQAFAAARAAGERCYIQVDIRVLPVDLQAQLTAPPRDKRAPRCWDGTPN